MEGATHNYDVESPAELRNMATVRALVPGLVAWLYGALLIGLVGSSTGGFLPTSWGWVGLITFSIAAAALLGGTEVAFGPLELTFLGGLLAFATWVALSNLWTPSVTSTMHEVQRNLAYLGVATAALVLVMRRTVPYLLGGVATGITALSLYALATRVLPDRFGGFSSTAYGYRLATPITYWNGLGVFVAMGIILCFGFAARGRHVLTRAVAAAGIPPLAATMYFTFSRGAWVAIGVGLAWTLLVDGRRLQLWATALVLAPWPALAVLEANRRPALTTVGATLPAATHDGHSLVPLLLIFAVCSAAAALVCAFVDSHVVVSASVRRGFAALLVAGVLLCAITVFVAKGAPWTLAERGWNSFKAPPAATGTNQSKRLLQLSSNGRIDLWRVSYGAFSRDPLLGNGAGTFWQLWPERRHDSLPASEGHSLYMETLGEVGLPGLLLLAVALIGPFGAALRLRRAPLVSAAAGAYVALLVHSAWDWDWELLAVGATGLLVAAALLRSAEPRRVVPPRATLAAGIVSVLLAAAALGGLLGDRALAAGSDALQSGDIGKARGDAASAATFAPWSSEPDQLRAAIETVAGDNRLAATRLRAAIAKDRESFVLWEALERVSSGQAHAQAVARLRMLDPHP